MRRMSVPRLTTRWVCAVAAVVVSVMSLTLVPGTTASSDSGSGFSVTNGFASYQAGKGTSTPTPVQFNVMTLVLTGTASAATLTISAQPASGSATADPTTGIVTFAPTASTSGAQVVSFSLCEAGPTDCQTAALTLAPGIAINNAFAVPTLGGYASNVSYVAAQAPASVLPGATFAEAFAPSAFTVPVTQTTAGDTVTVKYVFGYAYIIPIPANATYVAGSASVVGGDGTTSGQTTATECTAFGGSDTCSATSPSSPLPSETTTPYLELALNSSVNVNAGTEVTLPTMVVQFTAAGESGSTISPQLTEYDTGAKVTFEGTTQSNELQTYPVTPSFAGLPNGANAPAAVSYPLATTIIGSAAGGGGTQIMGNTWTDTGACGKPATIIAPSSAISMTLTLVGGSGGTGGQGYDASSTGYGGTAGEAGTVTTTTPVTSGQQITATTGCSGQSAPQGDGVVAPGGAGGVGWSVGGDGGDGEICLGLEADGFCVEAPGTPGLKGVNGSGGGGGGSTAVCLGATCGASDTPLAVAGGGGGGGETLCSTSDSYGGAGGDAGNGISTSNPAGGQGPSGSDGAEGGDSGAIGGYGGINDSSGNSFGGSGGAGMPDSFSTSAGSGGGGGGFIGGTGGGTGGLDCGAGGGGGGGSSWTSGNVVSSGAASTGDASVVITFSSTNTVVIAPPAAVGTTWTDPNPCGTNATVIAPAAAISMTVTMTGGSGGVGGEAGGTGHGGTGGLAGSVVFTTSLTQGAQITAVGGCTGQSAPQAAGVVGTGGAGGAGWSPGGKGGTGYYCTGALIDICLGVGGPDGSGGGGGGSSAVCVGVTCATTDTPVGVAAGGGAGGETACTTTNGGSGGAGGSGSFTTVAGSKGSGPSGSNGAQGPEGGEYGGNGGVNKTGGSSAGGTGNDGNGDDTFAVTPASGGGGGGYVGGTGGGYGGYSFDCSAGGGGGGGSSFISSSSGGTFGSASSAGNGSISIAFGLAPAPTVHGMLPWSGPTTGGTSVLLIGGHFAGATAVMFGTQSVSPTSVVLNPVFGDVVSAVSPPGTGTVPVTVTTPAGTARSPVDFTYVPPPVIVEISPDVGPASGGTKVAITGTGLENATVVSFGAGAAQILTDTPTVMTVITPAGGGVVNVVITTPYGTFTAKAGFTYYSCQANDVACQNINQLTISCAPPAVPPLAQVATCPLLNFPSVTLNGATQTTRAAAHTIYVTDDRGDPTVGWSLTTYMAATAANPNTFCAGKTDFCDASQGANVTGTEGGNGQIADSDLSISSPTCVPSADTHSPAPLAGSAASYPNGSGALALCSAVATENGGTFSMNTRFSLTIPATSDSGTYMGTVEYLVT